MGLVGWFEYYLRELVPDWFKVSLTWVFGLTSFVAHTVHIVLWVFCGMFLLDTITGYMVARRAGTTSSKRMQAGLLKLFLYFVVIACGALLDLMLFEEVKHRGLFYLSTAYCVAVEAQSVLENVNKLGGRTPTTLFVVIKRIIGGCNDLDCKGDRNSGSDSRRQ